MKANHTLSAAVLGTPMLTAIPVISQAQSQSEWSLNNSRCTDGHTTIQGNVTIDASKPKEAQRFDSKFVVHGNDDTLSTKDMAPGYKQLQRVEWARAAHRE